MGDHNVWHSIKALVGLLVGSVKNNISVVRAC